MQSNLKNLQDLKFLIHENSKPFISYYTILPPNTTTTTTTTGGSSFSPPHSLQSRAVPLSSINRQTAFKSEKTKETVLRLATCHMQR